ncbi:sperm-associated antigen 16 protein-like [Argonauta hians]
MAKVGLSGEDYLIKSESYSEDSDKTYAYDELSINEPTFSVLSEDYNSILKRLQEEEDQITEISSDIDVHDIASETPESIISDVPETVENFIYNFLAQQKMEKTLNVFQAEWYEMVEKGLISTDPPYMLPNVYTSVTRLQSYIKQLEKDTAVFKSIAEKAQKSYAKLQKQRDFHRMNHHRVILEKDDLKNTINRVRRLHNMLEPKFTAFKVKYESAMKHKKLTSMKLEQTQTTCQELIRTIKNLDMKSKHESRPVSLEYEVKDNTGTTQKPGLSEKDKLIAKPVKKDAKFPIDLKVNPILQIVDHMISIPTKNGYLKLNKTLNGHRDAVNSVSFHPSYKYLVTASDDKTWKIWSMPSGEISSTGEGHLSWVSDCKFNSNGTQLASCGGDKLLKIWNVSDSKCKHTFKEHRLAVWSCTWHNSGNFVATSSRDNSAKIWDLKSLRCKYTLRGHTNSVNSIRFVYNSNILLTSSTDKTVSLWDARIGICGQTFFGHEAGVNFAVINQKGDTIASCDTYGYVKLWDTRTSTPLVTFEAAYGSANHVEFDTTSSLIAVACTDETVKIYEISTENIVALTGHKGIVNSLEFEISGQYLVSSGSDATIRIWN